jgi:biopolymer transport protein ExbD
MAFYYSKRKTRPSEEPEGGELNIVPYLDMLMNLIIFMLLSISKKGFFVAGTGAVLGPDGQGQSPATSTEGEPTIPKVGDSYDFAALNAKMAGIKQAFPNETKVIVGAESEIAYETLIQTMDAIRETMGRERKILFSDVTLAAL